jgi:hypothetical protein
MSLESLNGNGKQNSHAPAPLIGLETGSVRMAKQIMSSKGAPFHVEDWPSVVLEGLRDLNENNWFPAMTLIVGNPGETDEDVMATIDLVYEMERRGLFAFLIPSIFTPLHDTRMEHETGVTQTKQLTPLQTTTTTPPRPPDSSGHLVSVDLLTARA